MNCLQEQDQLCELKFKSYIHFFFFFQIKPSWSKEHDMEKPGDKIRIPLVKHGMDMTFAIINIIYLSPPKIILYQSHIGSKNLDSSVLLS